MQKEKKWWAFKTLKALCTNVVVGAVINFILRHVTKGPVKK